MHRTCQKTRSTTLTKLDQGPNLEAGHLRQRHLKKIKISRGVMKNLILQMLPLLLFTPKSCGHHPIVYTTTGAVTGKRLTKYKVDAFLGIPYAIPPVGILRFKKPQPITSWSGIYSATVKPPACLQGNIGSVFSDWEANLRYISEDCLYLNIWVPASHNPRNPKAVMVWIHGGVFFLGSSNLDLYDGQVLASKNDVIVASLNYRLGAFGFMYLGTDDVPGNMGLWDQLLALEWLHQNIAAFGGDPSKVTLFGQSAGAISITDHMASPRTKGLFNRVILESGSSYSIQDTVSPSVHLNLAKKFIIELGCASNTWDFSLSYSDIIFCMLNKNSSEIVAAGMQMLSTGSFTFWPKSYDSYLPKNPVTVFNKGNFRNFDVMAGTVIDEGTPVLGLYFPNIFEEDFPLLNKADACFVVQRRVGNNTIGQKAFEHYFGCVPDDDYVSIFKNTTNVLGDYFLSCPVMLLTEKLSQTKPNVYHYKFAHRRSKSNWKEWTGVPHGEDVYFVFGHPFDKPENYTDEERVLSKAVMDIWTSFAKTGRPSSSVFAEGWLPYSPKIPFSAEIHLKKIKYGIEYPKEACRFWEPIFNLILK